MHRGWPSALPSCLSWAVHCWCSDLRHCLPRHMVPRVGPAHGPATSGGPTRGTAGTSAGALASASAGDGTPRGDSGPSARRRDPVAAGSAGKLDTERGGRLTADAMPFAHVCAHKCAHKCDRQVQVHRRDDGAPSQARCTANVCSSPPLPSNCHAAYAHTQATLRAHTCCLLVSALGLVSGRSIARAYTYVRMHACAHAQIGLRS